MIETTGIVRPFHTRVDGLWKEGDYLSDRGEVRLGTFSP